MLHNPDELCGITQFNSKMSIAQFNKLSHRLLQRRNL